MRSRRGRLPSRAFLLSLLLATPATISAAPDAGDSARIAVIGRTMPSVVHVRAEPQPAAPARDRKRSTPTEDFFKRFGGLGGEPKPQEGSGFVVDAGRGLILTAAHLVESSRSIEIRFADGSARAAAIAGIDVPHGIALLRVAGPLPPALGLAERVPAIGESTTIVGWMIPLRSAMAIDGMVMSGPVDPPGDLAEPFETSFIALDSTLPNGGFGGAPVVDRDGAVIGLVTAVIGRGYGPGALTLMIPAKGIGTLVERLSAPAVR